VQLVVRCFASREIESNGWRCPQDVKTINIKWKLVAIWPNNSRFDSEEAKSLIDAPIHRPVRPYAFSLDSFWIELTRVSVDDPEQSIRRLSAALGKTTSGAGPVRMVSNGVSGMLSRL